MQSNPITAWYLASAAILLISAASMGNAGETARVRVHSGTLVGSVDNGVTVFKGIPYAAPPVGALRLALPQPAVPWTGDRTANDFGPSCMQRFPPRGAPPGSRGAQLSEDCLTLNVWAPKAAKKAPVMVWIHGGANVGGSSAGKYYDGGAFARDGIVLVTLNYRLGAAGFQAHAGEANFGLWDQVTALRWVKRNIAQFGGDPGNVTLFGESAGGQDTLALMTAGPARGLFHKAIVESGAGGWAPNPSVAGDASGDESRWGVLVDGHLLKEPPLSAFAAGRAARIPLIIGTNSEEGSLLGADPHSEGLFPKLSAGDLAKLKSEYGQAQALEDGAFARLVFRDGYFASEARWIAAKLDAGGSPAYLYRFAYVLSSLQARRAGAFHGAEIPFVFDRMPDVSLDDTDMLVERALHDCWVAFARTGKPTCAAAPDWPAFKPGGKWMVFDAHPSARPVEQGAVLDLLQCRLAEGIPLIAGSCPAR